MSALATAGAATTGGAWGYAGLAAIFIAYWVPAIVAWLRHVPNKWSVLVVNLFLGWTVIGWIVAMAMAMRDRRPAGA